MATLSTLGKRADPLVGKGALVYLIVGTLGLMLYPLALFAGVPGSLMIAAAWGGFLGIPCGVAYIVSHSDSGLRETLWTVFWADMLSSAIFYALALVPLTIMLFDGSWLSVLVFYGFVTGIPGTALLSIVCSVFLAVAAVKWQHVVRNGRRPA